MYPQPPKDILDVLGGPSQTAREVERITGKPCDARNVANWRARGAIPIAMRPVLDQAITQRIVRPQNKKA